MVQGMAFLSKKRFNPSNLSNQKAVWEAQQQEQQEFKRIRERDDQLRRERDDEELARARGGSRGGDEAALRFMYGPPPGLPAQHSKSKAESASDTDIALHKQEATIATSTNMTERQPGDDDAAAAFRQMLAAASAPKGEDLPSTDGHNAAKVSTVSGGALAGTTIEAAAKGNENLSALEKAVGRKDANSGLTLEEQIARFPQLKNAPMAKGMNAANVNVSFKPLGTQLRHIRCMACGVWGHSRGDRECERSGWNPFASTMKPPASAAPVTANSLAKNNKSSIIPESTKPKDDARGSDDHSASSSSDSDDESYRRRKKKERKRRRRDEKRKRRSRSSDDRRSRKKSRKRRRKHASRDEE